jgi:hypothetical protein
MSDKSASARLYELLDTLVALQMSFVTGANAQETVETMGPFRMRDVLEMLDTAIRSTKTIIGELERLGTK